MTTLDQLGEQARVLALGREHLRGMVQALQKGLAELHADHLPGIRAAVTEASEAWEELAALVEQNPLLFRKPRTVAMHGIKFGFEKGKGGVEIADPERTVALIKKHLPEQADVLIATKEAPVRDALAQLSGADLKRIGVGVRDAGDQVVIRPADGEVDKLVKALVKAAVEEETK